MKTAALFSQFRPAQFHLSKVSVVSVLALSLGLFLGSCGGSGGSSDGGNAAASGGADLLAIHVGRIADVYGLDQDSNGRSNGQILLFQQDVLIGPDIQDERDVNSNKSDEEITYDFIGVDPDTLQPKLLITRVMDSAAFKDAFARLDDKATLIDAAHFGQDNTLQPFSVMPRNAALRLTFSKDLGLDRDFFLERDANGQTIGIKNPSAIELLEIVGDPLDEKDVGDFRRIITRISQRKNIVILDPVLLGKEGARLNAPNSASGLPASPLKSRSANMRIAISLEGPLRIRGLTAKTKRAFIGKNLAARKSIIRDFRSGNADDTALGIIGGFVHETIPPRIVGELPMRLERVEPATKSLIIYKAGIRHGIDRGDVLKLFKPGSNEGIPIVVTEVVIDPEDDKNNPGLQHVRVRVRDIGPFEAFDPSKRPDFPAALKEREPWLELNAPLLVLSTEFSGGDPAKGTGDDPRNFITFTPQPLPDPGQSEVKPNENISPFASLVVRWSKPINLSTVKPVDTMILATTGDTAKLLDAKRGTPHLIHSLVFDEDGSQTALRISPPRGFYLDDEMRKPSNKSAFPYFLHVIGGVDGIRDFARNPVDFQFANRAQETLKFEFFLDINKDKSNKNRFPNNRVVNIVRRFKARDEDESGNDIIDWFGPIALSDGFAIGRPIARSTSYIDDRNQLPSPPNFPFAFCSGTDVMTLTGATPLPTPILNPLNPWGCRLMTVWREIDLSLSRTDSFDFNLDVEQIWWAPGQGTPALRSRTIIYDVFDSHSLFLGHSERRPSNCISVPASFPRYRQSSLRREFIHNYARSLKPGALSYLVPDSMVEDRPAAHAAYEKQEIVIRHEDLVFDPTGLNRFLPLPEFDKKTKGYFVFRDERVDVLGGGRGLPQILSPFGGGVNSRFWRGDQESFPDDGKVGSIALPLLTDWQAEVDSAKLPKDDPFFATGLNGLQVSLTVTSSILPMFRVFSGGTRCLNQTKFVRSGDNAWKIAQGGWNPLTCARTSTAGGDNTVYWARIDFLRRMSVMTFGFINFEDPHNDKDHNYEDPRLGSNKSYAMTATQRPDFEVSFDPPRSSLPTGTSITDEYRVADRVTNISEFDFFDPLVAGNAHVRSSSGSWWNYQYTNLLSKYNKDPNMLFDADWLVKARLTPSEVKMFNFRFVIQIEDGPNAVPPRIDTYSLVFRIEDTK